MQCSGVISGLLSRTIQGYPEKISVFWTSIAGCLTKLTIDVSEKHLSAFCASTAPLVALQHLELSCRPCFEGIPAHIPAHNIAISLPQLIRLSLLRVLYPVALHLDSRKLQSLKLECMRHITSLTVSAPSLTHLALRSNIQPIVLQAGLKAANLPLFLASLSGLTNLELRTHLKGWYHDVEALAHLTSLTRLVTTQMPSATVASLPISLKTLIIEGDNVTEAPEILASNWHLESLQVIVPDCDGKLYNSELDVPWGMGSLRQWHRECIQDGLYPSEMDWLQEVLKEAKKAQLNVNESVELLTYRRHDLPGQQGSSI